MTTGATQTHKASGFDFDYNSLIEMNVDGDDNVLQFGKVLNDGIRHTFYHKGNSVEISVFDEDQYAYQKYMPEPKKIDFAKSIISPMPGAIV